jgi:hypothetical protein
MAQGKKELRRLVVAAVAVVSIALTLVSSQSLDGRNSSAAASSPAEFAVPSQGLVLRLHDLPTGYGATSGSAEFPLPGLGCAPIEPADPRPRLAAFLRRYSPVGCLALYFRLYRVPEVGPTPLAVGTGALDVGSVEGAEEGLAISRELLSHLLGDELPQEVPAPETVGDATRLFHWEPQRLFSSKESPSSFLVWRSGGVVASIFIAGARAAANDRAALHFARIQQAHIETPTPYTPDEADNTVVPLEDPALRLPIYWLGRTFEAGHGLRPLRLYETGSLPRGAPGARTTPRATLRYLDRLHVEDAEGVEIDIWTPRQWEAHGPHWPPPFFLRCKQTRRLNLPRGHAVLYRGVEPGWSCRDRQRKVEHMAVVHFPGVVLTAETDRICATCFGEEPGPYNSFAGMATIARGLELRLRPAIASP